MPRGTKPAGSTTRNDYGYAHQRLRAALLPSAIGRPCPRCGQTMRPGEPLDLDHTDNRAGYRGMCHSTCNRAAGARKTNAARRAAHALTIPRAQRW